ncbi:ulp1 protease family, C-terminal catalytic domain-containing protein [Artemisia annua]|uniref:Ulp1 protease family, C-terminal catalytic domain-containing protein n=1 Tax=Artemisia annua TaxID=35608 RepID=A0A2U1Q3W7_ARTAN|nr:ulp1 protease family, C-terminal catalytic domain-containing protein [Artemisia annua]
MKTRIKHSGMTDSWSEILPLMVKLSSNKSIMSILRRIVVAAYVCYIWNERNKKIFTNMRRNCQELLSIITNIIRMKLVSLTVKESKQVDRVSREWQMSMNKTRNEEAIIEIWDDKTLKESNKKGKAPEEITKNKKTLDRIAEVPKLKERAEKEKAENRKKAEEEKAENRKKLMDLEHDIQLNKPKSVLDGYNRWMSRGGDCADPYAIRVDKDIFRQFDESYFAINATDIVELLTNQELECGILTLFEMSLYHLKGRSSLNRVGFLNPGLITSDACLFEKWDTLDYLTRALEGYDFYLAPYLQGRHYVLFIICPKHGVAFILNSSRGSSKNEETYRLAGLVESVVGGLRWEFPVVNRQPFDWECGFYVMKWMHDFVLKYQNDNFPNTVPWSDERPLENKELNAIIGAWFTLWRD